MVIKINKMVACDKGPYDKGHKSRLTNKKC